MTREEIKAILADPHQTLYCQNNCEFEAVWIIVRMDMDVELPLCDNCRRALRMGMANHDKIRLEERL